MQNRWTWRDRGIRMNSVSPGPVDTPILPDFIETLGERAEEDMRVMDRPGCPSDIAPVVAFLLSDGAGWIRKPPGRWRHVFAHPVWHAWLRVDAFIGPADLREVDARDIDEAVLAELRDAVPEVRSAREQRYHQGCIVRFIAWLASTGVIDPPPLPTPPAPGSLEHLSAAYGDWMRHQQGLGQATIKERQAFLRPFMTFRFGAVPGDLNDITPDDIRGFLDLPVARGGRSGGGWRATRLRSFFRFLFASGRTRLNLAVCVPRIAAPPSRVSRHMPSGEVRQLVDAVHDDDGLGRRNYAMLMMMARLGLRAQEVIALRLDDINWAAGEILVRSKGGLHDRMPLPADVGEAIVAYIRDGRAGHSRHLFVASWPPHGPPTPTAIGMVLHEAFARTGLKPPEGGKRTHLLRHSLAVDMLGRGASLDEVGEVLRHRSHRTTTTYARYDIEALRSVARPWPVPGEAR